jgi:hypothetical protein
MTGFMLSKKQLVLLEKVINNMVKANFECQYFCFLQGKQDFQKLYKL